MVDKLPSPHTYLLLGDAYISIQEVRYRWKSQTSHCFPFQASERNTFFECYARFHVCPQPEKAFEVYQLGMKKNPKSAALASKTGKALIKSHYYFKVSLR